MATGMGGNPLGGGYNDAIWQRLMGMKAKVPMSMEGYFPPTTGTTNTDPATGVSNNLSDMFKGAIANGDPNTDTSQFDPLVSVNPTPGANSGPGMIPPTASLIKSPTGNYRRTGTPAPRKPKSPMVSGSAMIPPDGGRSNAVQARLGSILNKRRQNGGY